MESKHAILGLLGLGTLVYFISRRSAAQPGDQAAVDQGGGGSSSGGQHTEEYSPGVMIEPEPVRTVPDETMFVPEVVQPAPVRTAPVETYVPGVFIEPEPSLIERLLEPDPAPVRTFVADTVYEPTFVKATPIDAYNVPSVIIEPEPVRTMVAEPMPVEDYYGGGGGYSPNQPTQVVDKNSDSRYDYFEMMPNQAIEGLAGLHLR